MPDKSKAVPSNPHLAEITSLQKRLLNSNETELKALFHIDVDMVAPLLANICQTDNLKAAIVLQNLQKPTTQEAVCRQTIELNNPLVTKAVIAVGYQPSEPRKRALFYFLTEQWDKYDRLDFDQSLLRACYELETEPIRRRIAQAIRKSGKADWLAIVTNRPKQTRLTTMSDKEWELTIETLAQAEQWAELWQWAQISPARYSLDMIRRLADSGWQPKNPDNFNQLVALAQTCQTKLPPLGYLLKEQLSLYLDCDGINTFAMSPLGNVLAISTALYPHYYHEREFRLDFWDINQGVLVKRLTDFFKLTDFTKEITCREVYILDFSPNGELLACWLQGFGGIWLVDTRTYEVVRVLKTTEFDPAHIETYALAFNADGSQLVSVAANEVVIWDILSGSKLSNFELGSKKKEWYAQTPAVDISHDATLLVSYQNKNLSLWELPSGKLLRTLRISENIHKAHFSPNSQVLALSCQGQNYLWQVAQDLPLPIAGQAEGANLYFTQDNRTIAKLYPRSFQILDTLDNSLLFEYISQEPIQWLGFSSDGRYIVVAHKNRVTIWTSKLAELAYQARSTEDLTWLQQAQKEQHTTHLEQQWLGYIEAQVKVRWQHEIELDDKAIEPHEYDIELGE